MTTTTSLSDLAVRAYVYGFPLVFNLDQVRRFTTTGIGANPAAPFNAFSHARTLAGPADRFVSINNDTVYSIAQLDVSTGPLVLDVPDTPGRYHVLQFISAWTENFAYLGSRAGDTGRRRYLVVDRGWDEAVPSDLLDVEVIRCPTDVVSLAGRWAVNGTADLREVHRLQDATILRQVNPAGVPGLPRVLDEGLGEELAFWERYRVYSQAFPPPPRDRSAQDAFAELGLTGSTPVAELDDERRAALTEGYRNGITGLRRILAGGRGDDTTGWIASMHAFDYNIDHFEVGTRDESHWKIEAPEERLMVRAGAAMAGLWGCHAYEAVYFTAYTDAQGAVLTGENTYELTLNPTPPNQAFWSVTMYDLPEFHLVPNAIGRYSVGDRTPGLDSDTDGAVTITISSTEPVDAARRANWLPAPHGPFRPLLRVYLPDDALLDGGYVLPPIRRIN